MTGFVRQEDNTQSVLRDHNAALYLLTKGTYRVLIIYGYV